jgi:hypothetical protein
VGDPYLARLAVTSNQINRSVYRQAYCSLKGSVLSEVGNRRVQRGIMKITSRWPPNLSTEQRQENSSIPFFWHVAESRDCARSAERYGISSKG